MFQRIRRWFQKLPANIGNGCRIDPTVTFQHSHGITIGNDVYIGPHCVLDGRGNITIGDGTILGPAIVILSYTHQYRQEEYLPYGPVDELRQVTIGRGVWIGYGAMIVPGVTIGDGAVIAMGAVVTKDVEPGKVVGGNPAKIIAERDTETIDRLIKEKAYYIRKKNEDPDFRRVNLRLE